MLEEVRATIYDLIRETEAEEEQVDLADVYVDGVTMMAEIVVAMGKKDRMEDGSKSTTKTPR
eukprot:763466-Hanusia_phi.AAC.4